MNQTETKQVLEKLAAGRQAIDMFDEIAFRKVTANHTIERVVSAIAELRTRNPYVNPSDLRDELEKDGSADVWPAVSALITAGALRNQLDPTDFPSDRAYRAARNIAPQLMSGTPHSNAKAFADAYRRTPTAPAAAPALASTASPELEAVGTPMDELGRRRILAAARAALPARDDDPAPA